MAKKWPGMVVDRSFIKEHSFPYRLYICSSKFVKNVISTLRYITCDCLITLSYKARHLALYKKIQARPTKLKGPSTPK